LLGVEHDRDELERRSLGLSLGLKLLRLHHPGGQKRAQHDETLHDVQCSTRHASELAM
jgi:hypothetical protein